MTKFRFVSVSAALVLTIGASSAYAECTMPTEFALRQGNGFSVNLTDVHANPDKKNGFFARARTNTGTRGDVTGTVSDKGRLKMTIEWAGDSVGIYTGVVDDGIVEDGRTYDKTHPANWATWTSDDTIECDE